MTDATQIARAVSAVFKRASGDGYLAIRAFEQKKDGKPIMLRWARRDDTKAVVTSAVAVGNAASKHKEAAFFSIGAATFKKPDKATIDNVLEGVAIILDLDSGDTTKNLRKAESLLGPATLVVKTGGVTLEGFAKLHAYWRLKKPAKSAAQIKKLARARILIAKACNGDTQSAPVNKLLRWPGGIHRKAAPTPVVIERENDVDIELNDVIIKLIDAVPNERETHGANGAAPAIDTLTAAVMAVPIDDPEFATRAGWIKWGAAIHYATNGSDEGLALFDKWSRQSQHYDEDGLVKAWHSFKTEHANGATDATIFAKATEHGWIDDRLGSDLSQSDLALGFVERHKHELRYIAEWGKWVIYGPESWFIDTKLKIFDLAHEYARDVAAGKPRSIAKALKEVKIPAAILMMARSRNDIAATTDQWDTNLYASNTPDGIIDLRTGEMRDRTPDDYVLKCTAISPAMKESCPKWFKFLDRVTNKDKELQRYLQRVCGYWLTGVTSEHALFFFYGTGRNGKGTFVDTIYGIMGNYANTAPMEAFLASRSPEHSQELAVLVGARFVSAAEPEEGGRWNETRIKTLTGGDPIAAHFMRQNNFVFTPQFKLGIAGNHKPSLRSVDPAWRARIHLIPFTVYIPPEERIRDLKEQLRDEWPGIFRWMLNGCLEWQRVGLTPPATVIDATEEYFAMQDVFSQWIEERCIIADTFTETWRLYQEWKRWAEERNGYAGDEKHFVEKMEVAGFKRARRTTDEGKPRGFLGIRLNERVIGSKY